MTINSFRLLAEHPDLAQYRKQAKELLRACHASDPEAMDRFDSWLFRGKPFDPTQVKLNDAQVVIAREHGCGSWPKFVERIRDQRANGRDSQSFRQARDAILNNELESLRTLLRQFPELARTRSKEPDEAQQTLLHYVAERGSVEMARELVAAGARLDAVTLPFNMTPVGSALYEGNTKVALYLAEHDSEPLGITRAAGLGRLDVLRTLIGEHGNPRPYLQPGVYDPMRSLANAFRYACSNGQVAVVEYLLDLGLDVNVRLQDGATGMHLAAYLGHAELVRLLLQRGADKTVRDQKFGADPAGWAAEFGHHDLAASIAAF
ncbi:MAG TPA: ankyrin repeat domain-containing protein [Gammaproteobacteria bacterium]|nr:ankyrin repeat domain-containing protein [Gammaproteobacteria bacterium]